MLSKLHTSGFLRSVTESSDALDDLDQQTIDAERDAPSEVFNYSARYGLVPSFNVRQISRHSLRRGQNTAIEVKIDLPEQNISVTARRMDIRTAEIAAAVKFKEAAEEYHAEQGTQPSIVQEQVLLHTGNAKLFLDYYHSINRASKLELRTDEIKAFQGKTKGRKSMIWKAQMMGEQQQKTDSFLEALDPQQKSTELIPIVQPVTLSNKKAAEEAARLAAAVLLNKEDPTLIKGFRSNLSSSGTALLLPPRSIYLQVDEDAALIMEDTLRDARRAGLADEKEQLVADEKQRNDSRSRQSRRVLDELEANNKNENLSARHKHFYEDPALSELREKKAALPMSQYRDRVLELVDGHLYSVIVGATGSGKTTQVPQILLEDAISRNEGAHCNVVCTQPRRIAATSVARRVADERNEKLQDTVGYHVRFDPKRPLPGGSITYCTTGILLQQLQNDPDEVLDSVSHIIVDEVHERDVLIDFLIINLKNTIRARRVAGKPVPKVVLMSATIDSEMFAEYFKHKTSSGEVVPCPSLSVPGRTFPVKEKYLDTILGELDGSDKSLAPRSNWMLSDNDTKDYLQVEKSFRPEAASRQAADENGDAEATIDWKLERRLGANGQIANEKEDGLVPINLIAATVAHICRTSKEGAILVFLPGFDEMKKVAETLQGGRVGKGKTAMPYTGVDYNDPAKAKVFMLHSSVPANEQTAAFDPVPSGCRKIILSTNIAETSVTIPDVQFVVDTGKLREKQYDQQRRITKLQCTWISKSNAKQRAGRAGRVQNGNYYALYSRPRFESLRATGLPEMLRSDLQEICLDIKAQAFQAPIREFLSQAIEPPSPAAVDASVRNLQSLQALTDEEDITALGRLLAQLPVHPSLGKMIVLGVIFRCLDPMIILSATLSERTLFVSPPDKRREAQMMQQKFGEDTGSDHYALLNAFTQMRLLFEKNGQFAMNEFGHRNFLHTGSFKTIYSTSKQIEGVLIDAGLIPRIADRDRFESELGHPSLNTNSTNVAVIKALVLAGLHPNLALATSTKLLRTPGEKNAMIHPSSLNYVRETELRQALRSRDHAQDRGDKETVGLPPNSLVSYSTMARSNDGGSILLRDVTTSSPLMAVLFGGRIRKQNQILEMDNWLPFEVRTAPRTVGVLVEFRKAMDRMLTRAFQALSRARSGGAGAAAVTTDASASAGSDVPAASRNKRKDEGFADDEVCRLFAEGVVDVLNRDLTRRSKPRRMFGSNNTSSYPSSNTNFSNKGSGPRREVDRGVVPGDRGRGRDGGRQLQNDDDWIFGGSGSGFGKGKDDMQYAFGGKGGGAGRR